MNCPAWYVTKEGWQEHLKKWFPADKDIPTPKLKRQAKGYTALQIYWLIFALVGCVPLFWGVKLLKTTDAVTGFAILGASLGLITLSLVMYCQWRIYQLEKDFELRLREALGKP